MISLRNVSKHYRSYGKNKLLKDFVGNKSKKYILEEIDLDINDKDLISISGKNGAGKTTLLKIISNLILPSTGKIIVDGKDISNPLSTEKISLCSSNERSLFWRLSIIENINFFSYIYNFNQEKLDERIKYHFNFFNLEKKMNWKVSQLSSGEKKLVMLIISLIKDAKYYLCDEVLTNLDEENKEIFYKYYCNNIQGKKALIWVSHDNDIISDISTKKFQIKKNRLIEK